MFKVTLRHSSTIDARWMCPAYHSIKEQPANRIATLKQNMSIGVSLIPAIGPENQVGVGAPVSMPMCSR